MLWKRPRKRNEGYIEKVNTMKRKREKAKSGDGDRERQREKKEEEEEIGKWAKKIL